jgi:hypothetical protein
VSDFAIRAFTPRQTWYVHCNRCGWNGPERVLPDGAWIAVDRGAHDCPKATR